MEEDSCKKLSENFILVRHLDGDGPSSVNTDVPSDPWFDEEDIISSTPISDFQEIESNNDISYSILYSKDPDESKLLEKEIDLYHDLVMNEDAEKITKQKLETEVENLKQELQTLQEADARKSTRIEELTTENTNLKKSICSLYQTVKSEIEHKDHLLTEANKKANNLLFKLNEQTSRPNKQAKSQNHNNEEPADNGSRKRKRSKSPQPLNSEKEPMSNPPKTNNDKSLPVDKNVNTTQSNLSKSKERHDNELQKSDNQCVLYQASETDKVSDDSRHLTKTNEIFFNLIPESLKKSFYEYEQNQIESLNKLKQSLVNECFNSDANAQSLTQHTTQKRPSQSFSNNRPHYISSVNTAPLLTPRSNQDYRTRATGRFDRREPDQSKNYLRGGCSQFNSSIRTRNGRVKRSMQRDVMTLFSYRKQKVSFLEKKKLGLAKDGEKPISENKL